MTTYTPNSSLNDKRHIYSLPTPSLGGAQIEKDTKTRNLNQNIRVGSEINRKFSKILEKNDLEIP